MSPRSRTVMPQGESGTHRWRRLLVETPRPDAIRESPRQHWYVVATVCVGAFMGQLDASIVTVALPTLQTHFSTTVSAVEWVALSYLLVLVATLVAFGRWADMVGRKVLYMYGFGVFAGSSLLCALAPGLGWLVGARVLQGIGAAMLQANSVALITHAMPRDKLARGIGVQGAAQALGLAGGPAVGGALLSIGGWQLIFLVNVPVGVVGMIAAWFLLPRSHVLAQRTRADVPGTVVFALGTTILLAGLSFAPQLGWSSVRVVSALVAGLVLLAGFVLIERSRVAPLVDLALFRLPGFSAGVAGGLLSNFTLFGVLLVIPFYLHNASGLSSGQAGLRLAILPCLLGVTAPIAGRFADTVGTRVVTVAGMLVTSSALVVLVVDHHAVLVILALAVAGVGLGLFVPANNAAVMASAPLTGSGVAGGLVNTVRGLGTALGVAVSGAVFAGLAGQNPTHSSYGHALSGSMLLLTASALLTALVSATRPNRRRGRTTATAT